MRSRFEMGNSIIWVGLFCIGVVTCTELNTPKTKQTAKMTAPSTPAPKPAPLPMGPPAELHPARAKAREKELLVLAKRTPAKDVKANAAIYKELYSLNRKEAFKEKYERYTWLSDQEDWERDAEGDLGPEPKFNELWGYYPEVKTYLRNVAHDPSSIDFDGCSPVMKVPRLGYRVRCDYRAKNGYGALVKESRMFTIRHGVVINSQPRR